MMQIDENVMEVTQTVFNGDRSTHIAGCNKPPT